MKRLPPEKKAEVLDFLSSPRSNGMTTRETAELFGVSQSTIMYLRSKTTTVHGKRAQRSKPQRCKRRSSKKPGASKLSKEEKAWFAEKGFGT